MSGIGNGDGGGLIGVVGSGGGGGGGRQRRGVGGIGYMTWKCGSLLKVLKVRDL